MAVQTPVALAVLDEYAHWIGNLSGTGLVLSVDTGACVEDSCFNLTWRGSTKRPHEHVIDTVNESVVMDCASDATTAVTALHCVLFKWADPCTMFGAFCTPKLGCCCRY